jgi:hypothetical protein
MYFQGMEKQGRIFPSLGNFAAFFPWLDGHERPGGRATDGAGLRLRRW